MFLDANFLIYLNLGVREAEEFYAKLLSMETIAVNPLVLDEAIYISKKKYNVKFEDTIEFLDNIVLPYSIILPITQDDYNKAKEIILKYNLKPSDAFHVAVMLNNHINKILTEDKDFDNVKEIKRVWII